MPTAILIHAKNDFLIEYPLQIVNYQRTLEKAVRFGYNVIRPKGTNVM